CLLAPILILLPMNQQQLRFSIEIYRYGVHLNQGLHLKLLHSPPLWKRMRSIKKKISLMIREVSRFPGLNYVVRKRVAMASRQCFKCWKIPVTQGFLRIVKRCEKKSFFIIFGSSVLDEKQELIWREKGQAFYLNLNK